MIIEKSKPSTQICPTCGSRLNKNATRCLVCGRTFTGTKVMDSAKTVKGPHMPEITLSLPIALGLIVIILGIGAGVVFTILSSTGKVVEPTITPTITLTPTYTLTPTASTTSTSLPTLTPLPPFEYIINEGDLCSSISAIFNVSIQSIVLLNDLPADCGVLYVGQELLIPQPTPTASPLPTSTLSEAEATEMACEKYNYTVGENDTLSAIAKSFAVSIESIKDYNGLTSDIVYQGQLLIIPLCQRLPTPGPTPTPTLPPPYPAPNLLLPIDGEAFTAVNEIITLQWASVGTLRENEAYAITIEDVTEGTGHQLVEYVTDTKLIIPSSFRPIGTVPHIIRWSVIPVRQAGTTLDGEPIWEPFGSPSTQRVFSWIGTSVITPTP